MYINQRPFLHTPKKDTEIYQNQLFGILEDIDIIAEENSLNYTVEAGTALGAARHGGFIPWDNDADILLPVEQVKSLFIAMAKKRLFEKYDIWYYHRQWGWIYKDQYIPRILKDPENFCNTSLSWVVRETCFAVFRIVMKDTLTIRMGLDKGRDTFQVSHFDNVLSTAGLQYKFMTAKEKRTWRQRYLLKNDLYKVHPFVDVFPTIEMDPTKYIKMKKNFFVRDSVTAIKRGIRNPFQTLRKAGLGRFVPQNHIEAASGGTIVFEDYRSGVAVDYHRGIKKAREIKNNGDKVLVSKAPWNLRKIIPYAKNEIHEGKRIKFENGSLMGPNMLHQVLVNHYKDYKKLPPVEERIQHAYHLDPSQFEQYVNIND